jgi:hypothetical protein
VTYMDALGNLARTDVPNRAELIKRNVDRYLKDEIGRQQRALERLRQAIHNERLNCVRVRIGAWRTIMFARCRT